MARATVQDHRAFDRPTAEHQILCLVPDEFGPEGYLLGHQAAHTKPARRSGRAVLQGVAHGRAVAAVVHEPDRLGHAVKQLDGCQGHASSIAHPGRWVAMVRSGDQLEGLDEQPRLNGGQVVRCGRARGHGRRPPGSPDAQVGKQPAVGTASPSALQAVRCDAAMPPESAPRAMSAKSPRAPHRELSRRLTADSQVLVSGTATGLPASQAWPIAHWPH